MKKHIAVGFGASLLLLAVYWGIMTLAEGLAVAVAQAAALWYWILALAVGFGVQAGLFSFIREAMRQRRTETASLAASGGVSAGSMLACCAHHLSDLLPLLGFSGLAGFLASYQPVFLLAGILSNVVGITLMLEERCKDMACQPGWLVGDTIWGR